MLRFVDSARFPLQFHPAFPRGYLHPERIFETFQELKIVCIEQLQGARTLKLQSTCFSHWSEWQCHLANKDGAGRPMPHLSYRKPYTSAQWVRSSGDSSMLTITK